MRDNILKFPAEKASEFRQLNGLLAAGEGEKAVQFAQQAVSRGNIQASVWLGAILEHGLAGVRRDVSAALGHYQTAIDLAGSVDGVFGVARILHRGGPGVQTDLKRALQMYRALADTVSHSEAAVVASAMLQEGVGADVDLDAALRYAMQAVEARRLPGYRLVENVYWRKRRPFMALWWKLRFYTQSVFSAIFGSET